MHKERVLVGVAVAIVAIVLWSDTGLYESVGPEEVVAVDVPPGPPSAAYDLHERQRWLRRGRSFMRQVRR